MNKILIAELQKNVEFLKMLPKDDLLRLDTNQFTVPNKELNSIRKNLETETDHYVMTYNMKPHGTGLQLCEVIESAHLEKKQLLALKKAEKKWLSKGVSFAVYRKPLTFNN
jgi:hypothetical protein